MDVKILKRHSSVNLSRQVRLLCPWARHWTELPLPLCGQTGSNRWPAWLGRSKRSFRCLLVEVPWQINEYPNLISGLILHISLFLMLLIKILGVEEITSPTSLSPGRGPRCTWQINAYLNLKRKKTLWFIFFAKGFETID